MKAARKQAIYGIAVVGFFSVFLNLLVLASPIFSMQLFDRVLPSRSLTTLAYFTLFTLFAIGAMSYLDSLRSRALARIARWYDESTREAVLAASIQETLRNGAPNGQGIADLQTLRTFISSSGPIPLFDAPWVPLYFSVLMILHPLIGLVSLCAGGALLLLALINDIVTRKAMRGVAEKQNRLSGAAALAIRHADTVQAMGMQQALQTSYLSENRDVQQALQKATERGAAISGFSKFVRVGVQSGIMALGAWLVIDNKLTSGGMIAASIIMGRALAPIEQAIGAWRNLFSAREAYARLLPLVTQARLEERTTSLPPPKGDLSVEGLTFVPPNMTKPVVHNVSFALDPGLAMSIIGPSGGGKSTLCRLLIGSLKPSAGHVRLDGADLYRWNRNEIGSHVGYLPQAVELFSGTVAQNIARLGEVDDQAVVRAADLAGCHDMILRLPKGYETSIGDAGAYLSGGQRQRIGLARAIYGDPRLIILDEPDSHLDDIGLGALIGAINDLKKKGSTVIIVTHRQALIRPTDRMLVLAAGKLELFGDTQQVRRELQLRLEAKTRGVESGANISPVQVDLQHSMPKSLG